MLTSVHQIIVMDDAKGKTNNCFWILCKVPHKRVKRKILKNSSDSAGCGAKVKKKKKKFCFNSLILSLSFPNYYFINNYFFASSSLVSGFWCNEESKRSKNEENHFIDISLSKK